MKLCYLILLLVIDNIRFYSMSLLNYNVNLYKNDIIKYLNVD